MTKSIALVIALAVLLHLILGWMWVVLAAAIGGWMIGERGWIVGGIGTFAAWLLLVAYNFVVAPEQVSEMTRVMAGILGGLPPVSFLILTLVMAFLLGALGGLTGTALASFNHHKNN